MEDINIITSETEPLPRYFAKAWKYKGLIITFAKRDLRIKYAQTFFDVFWILIQPLPSIVIFTFFFGKLIKVNTGALPYPVFALTGLVAWNFFTNLAGSVGNSLIESQSLLKKIYFPKIIVPFSKILVSGVDLLISFALLIVVMLLFSVYPSWKIIFLPCFFLFNILCGLSIGIWIAALTYRYRDFQHFAPNVINFSIWLTPVFYPTTVLPQRLHSLMYLNPMAFVIEGYRFALAGDKCPSIYFMISVIPVLILFVLGLLYFRRIEDEIADFI